MIKPHPFRHIMGVFIFLCMFFMPVLSNAQENQRKEETYPLFSHLDLYCSFFLQENALPETKISGAEREDEKILFSDGDVVYINQGLKDGLSEGQLFLVLEVGRSISQRGHLMFMKGRVRLFTLEENHALGMVEKSCGAVRIGNFLVPFKEKEGLVGRDEGHDVFLREGEGASGNFLYIENENVQIGRGHRAIIDLGRQHGLVLGQQLLIFRRSEKDAPLKVIGNSIVIDVQDQSSTIKILSSEDAITTKDKVRLHNPSS